ncbi:MAG: hypothetical protein M0D57_19350 [Sphingobacteriales bacterium JAD_PAG50586_3]|nr:MAG: hypothetical protein M0D57_19350 [Sphingobacteriales bacterium JAD_PAG50586_3]
MGLNGRHILIIVSIAICLKLLYVLFAVVVSNTGTHFENDYLYKVDSLKFNSSLGNFSFRHDAGWYEKIARDGHHKITPDLLKPDKTVWRQSYYAFFPLYPFTIAAIQNCFGLGFHTSAILLAFILSLAAFVVFYAFARAFTKSDTIALLATVVLMVSPFTFYYSMAMTEAYFLLLLTGSFIAVHKKNILFMLLLPGFLVLTRVNGIVMLLPLGLYYLEKHVFEGSWRLPVANDFKKLLPGFALLSMPVVFIGYCFYLKEMTGDFFAFSTAQAGWGKAYANPLMVLLKPEGWRWAIEAGITIGVLALSLFHRKKYL